MGYDWEFDGSVDFAPPNYRMEKYKKCEELGKQVKDEESAIAFLEAFKYVDYLANNYLSEIKNWQTLIGYEEMSLSMLKSKEAIFKWVLYPSQHQMWKAEFNYLRGMEKYVETCIDICRYMEYILAFNEKYSKINKENDQYSYGKHTLYWVKDVVLKIHIREKLNFTHMAKKERVPYLTKYGVVIPEDYNERLYV